MTNTSIIILAAGASTRLGQPKQKLVFMGKSLLQHAIDVAVATGCHNIVLVLGSGYRHILLSIDTTNVMVVQNDNWQQGMASSMQAGLLKALEKEPTLQNAIITLCDQPFVTTVLLNELIEIKVATSKNIVASAYNQTVGPPVLFNQFYFQQILSLAGYEGAKKLIVQYMDDVTAVSFDQGKFDIDTKEDYEALLDNQTSL